MNRPFGNLPISAYNSPSIVFNKRTSGWMPPAYSTLQGRNQIVGVDENMNYVRELSNDFPPAQMAVWDTPQGQYPPGVIPGPPYAPGASPLSGLGAFLETATNSLDSIPIVGGPLAAFKDWLSGVLGTTFGKVVYFGALALAVLTLAQPMFFVRSEIGRMMRKITPKFLRRKLNWVGATSGRNYGRVENPKRRRNTKPFGRWKNKKYARRHGKKKMSASYMHRHNKRGRRNRRSRK